MGDPFLRAYYSIYDLENKKIGLVGISETVRQESIKKVEESDENVFENFMDNIKIPESALLLNLIIAGGNVVVICLGVCICCWCYRKMQKREHKLDEQEDIQKEMMGLPPKDKKQLKARKRRQTIAIN